MQQKPLAFLFVLALTLAGCGTHRPASVRGGECQVFERPEYVVLGRSAYDQKWIDGNIEAGIAACQWDRPAKRPESLQQARPAQTKAVKRKPTLRERVKAIIRPATPAAVSLPPATAPVPFPQAKPADPFDELLYAPAPPDAAVKPKRKSWFEK